jgi:ABC-2 type transport system permease protein
LTDALHAEWTKLRLPSTGWLLFGNVVLTVAVSAAVCAVTKYAVEASPQDTTKLALTGIELGQVLIVILAVQVISGEYTTGMISLTFVAMPRRLIVLAAKAMLIVALTLGAGAASVIGSLVAGQLLLRSNGFTTRHGYASISVLHAPTLRAAAGSVLYLALVALLSLGVATATRDAATAIGSVLALLFLFPIIGHVITNPTWQRHLKQLGPMTAGLSIENTINLHSLPIDPWSGLAVISAWAAVAFALGITLLKRRDVGMAE